MRYALILSVAAVLAASGCGILWPDGRACTADFRYGLNAHVTDAAGAPVTNATLTLREGTYTEVMQLFPTGDYVGAGERPGTYSLTIEAPGVPGESVSDIIVGHDGCHVIGVVFDVVIHPDQIVVTRH